MVRPVLEYVAPVLHPLLTITQIQHLERLQAQAFKIIFGWKVSYATALDGSGAESLQMRREELFKKFTVKAAKNVSFKKWFR